MPARCDPLSGDLKSAPSLTRVFFLALHYISKSSRATQPTNNMSSSISPTAAANWTQGQLRNLVPTAWTVTDGNITGIGCDFTKGSIASFYECAQRLGHMRARCYGDKKINGTTVCTCSSYSGWNTSCGEARCTYGTVSGCATRDPTVYYLLAVVNSISLVFVTFTLLYALSTVWKGRTMCSRNVTNTTLAWLTLASLSIWAWYGSIFLANTVLSNDELMVRT